MFLQTLCVTTVLIVKAQTVFKVFTKINQNLLDKISQYFIMIMENKSLLQANSLKMGALNVGTSPEYKIVVIGPRRVGKSGLVFKL